MKPTLIHPSCPYCGTPLGGQVGDCPLVCGATHHVECWQVNSGCATLGCPANPEPRQYNGALRPGFVVMPLKSVRAYSPAKSDGMTQPVIRVEPIPSIPATPASIPSVVATRRPRSSVWALLAMVASIGALYWCLAALVLPAVILPGGDNPFRYEPTSTPYIVSNRPTATDGSAVDPFNTQTAGNVGSPHPPTPHPSVTPLDPRFVGGSIAPGSMVEVTTGRLNIRTSAGVGQPTITSVPVRGHLLVVGGPNNVEGRDWWQVIWDRDANLGWSSGAYLRSLQLPSGGWIAKGSIVRISTAKLNVHPEAGTQNSPIAALPSGYHMLVIGGPVLAHGVNWWEVVWDSSLRRGWASSRYLQAVGSFP